MRLACDAHCSQGLAAGHLASFPAQCEADAVAFVDEAQSGLHAVDGQPPPVLPDGSYVFAARYLAEPGASDAPAETGMRFEVCLQLQGGREGTSGAPQDARAETSATRVRVVLQGGPGDGRAWELRRVEARGCLLRPFPPLEGQGTKVPVEESSE